MKKFLALLSISLLLNSCYIKTNTPNTEGLSNLDEIINSGAELSEEVLDEGLSQKDKIINKKLEEIKKKLELKGLITKGDMYFEEKNYMVAIAQYQKALKEMPNDIETNMKIGNIYYEMKRFDKAYEYYKKIKSYVNLDKKKAIYSLINGTYNGEGSLNTINEEIDSFSFSEQEAFYYKNSLICTINFSKCRANFEEYFKTLDTNKIEINFKDLATMKEVFINYKNFGLEDLNYKAALVTGGFYRNEFYWVALETGKNILKESPNYKPILKIVAKSAYELGDYATAKEYLLEYNKVDDKDAEISYFLGRVYEKLGDKLLSSVHFTKAINIGYPDVNDIRRRLIFIYFETNDTKKMLQTFEDLIDSKDKKLNLNDYNLAIYYNIANDELEKAKTYSLEGIKAFPNSELFYSYYAWIMLQKDDLSPEELTNLKENIDKALEITRKNAMLMMVEGIYYFKTKDFNKAFTSFKTASSLDSNKEFKEEIDYWLTEVNGKLKK